MGAPCSGANLSRADLSGADLSGANLSGANLNDAKLKSTPLDSEMLIQGLSHKQLQDLGFEIKGQYVYGYRSRISQHVPDPKSKEFTEYKLNKEYSAPWFSRDFMTECAPGLYFCPTVEAALGWSDDLIKVRAAIGDVIKAGDKYRCPKFKVVKILGVTER